MSVPFRGAAVVLGVPLNSTEPVPVRLAPDVTVSHVAVLVAVHGQDAEVVTVTALPGPPPAATAWLVGLIPYVQAICETVKVWPAIVSVPLRGAVVLSVALNSTEPLPVPRAPDVTVSHVALLVAVHGQSAAVVTVTGLPGKTPAASVWLVELIAYVQAGGAGGGVGEGGVGEGGVGEGGVGEGGVGEGGVGEGGVGGGGACGMPRWMTVCMRSAMVTVPVRLLLPLLALTRYSTLPLPAPSVPEVIVIHSALLRAVHLHASCVVTTMLAVSESADNVRRSWSIVKRHGAASCLTRTRLSLMAISSSRIKGNGLGAATNATLASPWPDAGDRFEIQWPRGNCPRALGLSCNREDSCSASGNDVRWEGRQGQLALRRGRTGRHRRGRGVAPDTQRDCDR